MTHTCETLPLAHGFSSRSPHMIFNVAHVACASQSQVLCAQNRTAQVYVFHQLPASTRACSWRGWEAKRYERVLTVEEYHIGRPGGVQQPIVASRLWERWRVDCFTHFLLRKFIILQEAAVRKNSFKRPCDWRKSTVQTGILGSFQDMLSGVTSTTT